MFVYDLQPLLLSRCTTSPPFQHRRLARVSADIRLRNGNGIAPIAGREAPQAVAARSPAADGIMAVGDGGRGGNGANFRHRALPPGPWSSRVDKARGSGLFQRGSGRGGHNGAPTETGRPSGRGRGGLGARGTGGGDRKLRDLAETVKAAAGSGSWEEALALVAEARSSGLKLDGRWVGGEANEFRVRSLALRYLSRQSVSGQGLLALMEHHVFLGVYP